MKQQTFLFTFLLTSILSACAQKIPQNLQYIETTKASSEPRIFAQGFISKDTTAEFGSVFNASGSEFFYADDTSGKAHIKYTKIKNGKWTEPRTIISHPDFGFNDPCLSPDESKLYYISNLQESEQDTSDDYDIWYSERLINGWSEPINAGQEINSVADEFYISFTENGSMYFASNIENYEKRKHDFNIFKSTLENGNYLSPTKLPDSINTKRYEADVFIAPDESYIIFCSAKRSGYGSGDLYINFKNENGEWTETINMGEKINSKHNEICPFVTRDGKYFFYTSNQDIYWVSTDIFNQIKTRHLITKN